MQGNPRPAAGLAPRRLRKAPLARARGSLISFWDARCQITDYGGNSPAGAAALFLEMRSFWACQEPNCSELPKETAINLYAALDVASAARSHAPSPGGAARGRGAVQNFSHFSQATSSVGIICG